MIENKPLILVVNDDGIAAPGIHVLMNIMQSIGIVYVVAPDSNRSGSSHSMTLNQEIFIDNVKSEKNIFICSGTPVDCVKLALNKILPRKPDLCVSGINHGSNHSINGLYSGTLHAAMEGTIHGIPSISFSHLNYNEELNLIPFAPVIKKICEQCVKNKLPKDITLNINFPNIPYEDIKGLKVCAPGEGMWEENFTSTKTINSKNYYLISGQFKYSKNNLLTDSWALNNNFISIVPVSLNSVINSLLDELKYLEYDF